MNFFDLSTAIDLSVLDILIRLVTGLFLSLLIVYHYNKNSNSLSDRNFFSRTFPLILMTTLLVISVVKSSLALSLGLVGALSIVRFRTPIKEPEDLAYLFICIAAGVGLGAGAVLATSMAIIFILVVFTIFLQFTEKKNLFPHYLTISKNKNTEIKEVDEMIKIISKFCDDQPTIRRIDYNQDSVDVLIHISLPKDNKMIEMLSTLRIKFSNTEFTVLDQSKNILT